MQALFRTCRGCLLVVWLWVSHPIPCLCCTISFLWSCRACNHYQGLDLQFFVCPCLQNILKYLDGKSLVLLQLHKELPLLVICLAVIESGWEQMKAWLCSCSLPVLLRRVLFLLAWLPSPLVLLCSLKSFARMGLLLQSYKTDEEAMEASAVVVMPWSLQCLEQ